MYEIRDASPEDSPVIVGLTGPSGSGKTFSALRLAHGIQQIVGGDIGVIDTEGRRAKRYSNREIFPFKFKHMDFVAPHSSDAYREALADMQKSGVKTIIIDSMSHEHEGEGGYLEFHEKQLDRMAGDDYKKRERMTFTAWIKPAGARRRLINSFLQTPANFILCFRAKEKLKIVTGGAPIPLGWQAIAGDEFVYEMIARCLLLPGSMGVPDWSEAAFKNGAAKRDTQDRGIFPDGAQLSEAIGRNLALASNGKPIEKVAASSTYVDDQRDRGEPLTLEDFPEELIAGKQAAGRDAALKGSAALRDWFIALPNDLRLVLTPFKDGLKASAAGADKVAP